MMKRMICMLAVLLAAPAMVLSADMPNSCREGTTAGDMQVRVDLLSDCLQSGISERNRGIVLINLASAYVALEQYDPALGALEEGMALVPDVPEGYFVRGFIREKQGDEAQALGDYDRAIELKEDFVQALVNRGAIYGRQGDQQKALEDYDRAIAVDPGNALAYLNRGAALATQGDYEKAEADLTRSIELGPPNAEAYAARAAVNHQLGRDDAAKVDAARARELDAEISVPNL